MKYNAETKTLLFETSGRSEICNNGIVGINEEGRLFQGYDGVMSFFKMDEESFEYGDTLSSEERNELVNYMIDLWNRYRDKQRFRITEETCQKLIEALSSINKSAKDSAEIVDSINDNMEKVIESNYEKAIHEISINIVYLSNKRNKSKFWFIKKWHDWRIAKSNKLLLHTVNELNRFKELK